MPEEEKELTLEEMKSLVSLATLLPALLEKISAINKDLLDLKNSFNDIKQKFNTNTGIVSEYKKSVDELIKKQPDIKSIESDLKVIKQALIKSNSSAVLSNDDAAPAPQKKKAPTVAEVKPKADTAKDEDKDKVLEIVDKILANHRGRKTRVLTAINIKNGFQADDVIAAKVLKWFEDRKMYNTKLHMLTFPKR